MEKKDDIKDISFEDIMKNLENITQKLDIRETKLEDALKSFEQAVSLVREGNLRLDKAERRLEVLQENGDVKSVNINDLQEKSKTDNE